MIEHDQAAVLGRLHDPGVAVGPERQTVRTAHARRQQGLDRLRDVLRVVGELLARPRSAAIAAASVMPTMPAAFQPWKTATFSASAMRRAAVSTAREVEIDRAAVEVAQLGAGDGEVGAQLGQREHAPLARRAVPWPAPRWRRRGPDRRPSAPSRAGPEKSTRRRAARPGQQPLLDLAVELAPAVVADRRVGPQEVVHRPSPFKLPMPSEPPRARRRRRRLAPSLALGLGLDLGFELEDGAVVNRYVRR